MIAIKGDKVYLLQNSTSWEVARDEDDIGFGELYEFYSLYVKLNGQRIRVANSSNYRALKKFMRTAVTNVNKDMSLKEFLEQDFAEQYPDLMTKINLI